MRKLPAYPLYLGISAAHGLFFSLIVTVNLVYQAAVVGLDPFQLVLVGTALELSVFLFEIPTGIVADATGRRRSVIIGYALMGLGFCLEGAIPRFETVLLAQAVWGVGWTFVSGAQEAWIADEIGEARAGRAFLRGAQWSQWGGLVGMGLSVAIASVQVNFAILAGGGLYIALALVLGAAMPERNFQPTPAGQRRTFGALGQAGRRGLEAIRRRPLLLTVLAIAAVVGGASEGFDRLWTAHVLAAFEFPALGGLDPIVWFGILRAVAMLLSVLCAEWARRRIDTADPRAVARTLLAVHAALGVAVLAFALAAHWALALAAFWIVQPLRAVSAPLYTAWLNQGLPSRIRATVLSLGSQADALGQVAVGPLLGWVGSAVSLRAALAASGGFFLLVLPLYGAFFRRITGADPSEAPLGRPRPRR